MKLTDKTIVITGAAAGIGRAMALRFAAEKPRALFVSDRDLAGAEKVAAECGGTAVACDVSREAEIQALVKRAGAIDVFVANAGIAVGGGVDTPDAEWQRIWEINVMAHVWGARAVLPSMVERGGGYWLSTASAAGLLTMVGALPYSVTKHAVVSFCEWLSVMYGNKGIKVSCLCPLFVNTELMRGALTDLGGASVLASGTVIEPAQVADAVVAGIDAEKFLILPHPEVATFFQRKASDYDRWLNGMRRLSGMI